MYVILNYLSPQRDALLLLSEAGLDRESVQNEQGWLIRERKSGLVAPVFSFMRSVCTTERTERG